ncbi:hypothetical protein ACIQU6_44405 [Streptomyces sp. NPDC090442]|uniref:hypothetical protein n=1 Tax=Streptomyces sp. NPDC090442 TaxID=3365962 RepID=UPI003830E2FE
MTITQEHTTPLEVKSARELITPGDFIAVAGAVQRNNEGMAANVAEAITEEALKFVAACSAAPHARLKPSRVVDELARPDLAHDRVRRTVPVPAPVRAPRTGTPGRRTPRSRCAGTDSGSDHSGRVRTRPADVERADRQHDSGRRNL